MGRGEQIFRGVTRWGLIGFGIGWVVAAFGLGCLYGNCPAGFLITIYPPTFALLITVAGPTAAVFAAAWLLHWAGLAWIFKWIPVVGGLLALAPWAVTNSHQMWRVWDVEAREIAKPLPPMAERTPLVLFGGEYEGRLTFKCSYTMLLMHKTQGPGGILAARLSSLKGLDFTKPVALADLPLELHSIEDAPEALLPGPDAAAEPWVIPAEDGGDAPGQALKDHSDMDDVPGEAFRIRALSAEERKAAAQEIDYVIISGCRDHSLIDRGLDLHPGLQDLPFDTRVSLAFAPLQKGAGVLDLAALDFDLLDLDWRDMAEGLIPWVSRANWARDRSPGIGYQVEAFCVAAEGGRNPAC